MKPGAKIAQGIASERLIASAASAAAAAMPAASAAGASSAPSASTSDFTGFVTKETAEEIHLRDLTGRVTAINTKDNEVRGVLLKKTGSSEREHTLVLYQGIPRGSKFDYVIEKATELGVHKIVPFLSKKNVVKISAEKKGTKVPRWARVAKAAAKQCNRADVPTVESPKPLKDLSDDLKNG